MNFRKSSKRPLTPPPSFSENHIAIFSEIHDRSIVYNGKNLQNYFLGWKWPLQNFSENSSVLELLFFPYCYLSLSFQEGKQEAILCIFVRFFICPWTPQTPIHRLAPPFWGVKPYCEAATEPPLLLFKFGDTSLKSGDTFHEWGGADGTHLQLWALLRSHEASNKIRLHAQFHLIWMAPQHITKMAIKWNLTDVIAQKARGDGIELGLFKPDLHSEI